MASNTTNPVAPTTTPPIPITTSTSIITTSTAVTPTANTTAPTSNVPTTTTPTGSTTSTTQPATTSLITSQVLTTDAAGVSTVYTVIVTSAALPTGTPSGETVGGGGTNLGAIVGGAVGGGVGLILLTGMLWYCLRRRNRRRRFDNLFGSNYDSTSLDDIPIHGVYATSHGSHGRSESVQGNYASIVPEQPSQPRYRPSAPAQRSYDPTAGSQSRYNAALGQAHTSYDLAAPYDPRTTGMPSPVLSSALSHPGMSTQPSHTGSFDTNMLSNGGGSSREQYYATGAGTLATSNAPTLSSGASGRRYNKEQEVQAQRLAVSGQRSRTPLVVHQDAGSVPQPEAEAEREDASPSEIPPSYDSILPDAQR
ncbi:hypothetical protein BOTBODRAFT_145507 [Botryobasidium botryosum FD-172 SS1]|uniref:Mid2 domain-containing protein n=1 Tax=Botryobasidium botryosum (strain FD-172 SS1) TaxID=930990 RepID=A0A067MIV2_BOTB1|nr:hypothetical protein BOTBODRAFT_145507 [Botryobasidium botryosum FD-172 SS1]